MAEGILSGGGIYAIRNQITGSVYVGSAISFKNRFQRHIGRLQRGDHHSLKLQRAWIKYGSEAFAFEVLEVVSTPARLLEREQDWIDRLGAFGEQGYNMVPKAGSHLGAKRGEEARRRLSEGQRGRRHPPEVRAKIAQINAMRPPASEETRAKLSAANRGQKRSAEARASMSAAQRAFVDAGKKRRPISDETRAKLAAGSTGRRHTEEAKAKVAAAKQGKKRGPMPPEWRAKIAEALRGRSLSPDHRAKLSEIAKADGRRPPATRIE